MIVLVLKNTPTWAWVVLALTVWLGWRALKPRSILLWRAAILPIAATALALWRGANSASVGPVLSAWFVTLLAGALIGFRWASSLPVEPLGDGRVRLPGTRVWLVLGLVIFVAFYAFNVTLAFHPEWRSRLIWIVAPYLLGGLAIGIAWGWLFGLLKQHRPSRR